MNSIIILDNVNLHHDPEIQKIIHDAKGYLFYIFLVVKSATLRRLYPRFRSRFKSNEDIASLGYLFGLTITLLSLTLLLKPYL